jgi:hypothetical protein
MFLIPSRIFVALNYKFLDTVRNSASVASEILQYPVCAPPSETIINYYHFIGTRTEVRLLWVIAQRLAT